MHGYLQDLANYNNWANQSLLEFVETQPPETLDLTTPGVYGTVRETLAHVLSGEKYFLDHFTDDSPTPLPDRPGMALLLNTARDSAARLNRLMQSLPDPETTIAAGTDVRAVKTILTQLFTHAVEHRTQVCTILSARGIPLPEFDSWAHGIFAGNNSWPDDIWGPEPPDRQSARFAIR